MSALLSPHIERTRFERRDERVNDWLADIDRRQGPRRFAEVEAARIDDIESGGSGRMGNQHVHPFFEAMFRGLRL